MIFKKGWGGPPCLPKAVTICAKQSETVEKSRILVQLGILLFIIMLPVITVAATVDLPRTGQTGSYDGNTPQADEGAIQSGAAWPSPRFTDPDGAALSGDIVLDRLTGLQWPKNANTPSLTGTSACAGGHKTWQGALDYVACLNINNYLGHKDWRLPNINELESLLNLGQANASIWLNGQGFSNVQPVFYWSSTSCAKFEGRAWMLDMNDGGLNYDTKNNSYLAWPVRAGQCGVGNSTVCLSRTGQTTSYDLNSAKADDGALQSGVAWPAPRYTNPDGTLPVNHIVLDNLTGLQWPQVANTPEVTGTKLCPGGKKTWQAALDYVACLNINNYLGHKDWRLPNNTELKSLVNFGQPVTAAWLNGLGIFINMQPLYYWSSTSYAGGTSGAWSVDLNCGRTGFNKFDTYYVLPVRSGRMDNPDCTFAVSPGGEAFISSGGTDIVSVVASGNCGWTASSNASWLNITAGGSGSGTGTLNFTASPNNGTGPRTGTLTIAGQTFTITQLNTATNNKVIQLPKSGQNIMSSTGDDGDLQKGLAWPSPRFTNGPPISSGVVLDKLTGLQWAKAAATPEVSGTITCVGGYKTWQGALDYVACLNANNYLGHNDWRLPNINELESLMNSGEANTAAWLNGQGFSNVQPYPYWSSTTYMVNTSNAWFVGMGYGVIGSGSKGISYYVWPVRSGQCESGDSVICLPKTGQSMSFDANTPRQDDGAVKTGVSWPEPRFTYNGDGTMADNLTGLIWTKDSNSAGPASCNSVAKTWQEALDYVACLNANTYLGHKDWRLPNSTELKSLVNVGMANTASWLNGQGFINVQFSNYWSSTTYAGNTGRAWIINFSDGNVSSYIKVDSSAYSRSSSTFVMCVRGQIH